MFKRIFNFSKERKGMTLVGAIIAAGIVAGLALVFTRMMTDSMKGQKKIENLSDISMLHQRLVRLVTSDQSFCDELVFDKVLGDSLVIPTNLVTANSPIKITKMTLINPSSPPAKLSATTVLATTPTDVGWDTFIEVEYDVSQNMKTFGTSKRTEYIPVMVDNFVVLGIYKDTDFGLCTGTKILSDVQLAVLEEYDASNGEVEMNIGICKDGAITNKIKGCVL